MGKSRTDLVHRRPTASSGSSLTVAARIVTRDDASLSVVARTASKDGRPCGRLESDWRPANGDVVRRAGIPLPDYLLEELDP